MQDTQFFFDNFSSYLTSPMVKDSGLDLSNATIMEILSEYANFRRTLNPMFDNCAIVRKIRQLQEEFHCIVMPPQITDIFYANFIQWAHMRDNCYSSIKLYCNQLKSALVWSSFHGGKLSPTYSTFSVPRHFRSRVALSQDEISHIAHFNVFGLPIRPQYQRTMEKVRDTFVLLCNLGQRHSDIRRIAPEHFSRGTFKIIQQKTGNKAVVDIDRYSIIPKLTHSLLEKYNYTCPYKGNLNNFNMYLHRLLRMIGEEFNDIVITEVKTNGKVEHISHRKWELCTSHTGRRSFITYNVMRCPTEIEVRRCSGHSSSKTLERYISMDED